MQLNTYKTILGMIPPKVAQIGVPMVVVCKDDELGRTLEKTTGRYRVDFETEIKKSNMITKSQMAECLGVSISYAEKKLYELVKKGIAKRHRIGVTVFFSHVENEVCA
jgi:hypothetical protein